MEAFDEDDVLVALSLPIVAVVMHRAPPPRLDPYGRASPVGHSIEQTVLDIPVFLRRRAN